MKRPLVIALLIIALLIVLAGIGAVAFFTANGGFQTNSPFDRNNISSVVEESKTLKVDVKKTVTLKVADDAGDVTVTGGDVETVQVKAIKTAYDSSQARADEEVKGIQYTIEQTGNAITLKYEIPDSMNFNNNVNTVDFIVIIPNEAAIDVSAGFGDVNVSDIKGNVTLANNFGEVKVTNIEGALSVGNESGGVQASAIKAGSENVELHSGYGKVTLEKAGGANITIDSNSGAIAIDDVRVTGTFSIKTDFGDATYENGSASSLNVETQNGKVSITKVNVRNELKVNDDFGEIELVQSFAGSYDLHTNSGAITVDGAKNMLKAYTDFGNIKIKNAQSVTLDIKTKSGTVEFSGTLGAGPHIVKSDFGGIDLALPADVKLNVDLTTDFGDISTVMPITFTPTDSSSSDKKQIVGSINGGGEQLTVTTNSGDINITTIK